MALSDNMKLIITPEEIQDIVKRLASEISAGYNGKNPVLIGALKASFIFLSDLSRSLALEHELDFIQTSSYGRADEPSHEVLITNDISTDISDRHCIVVDTIIDRGRTANAIEEHLKKKGPSSVRLCALLLRSGEAEMLVKADYVGKRIGAGFVAGYGMDYKERLRGLPGIHIIKTDE